MKASETGIFCESAFHCLHDFYVEDLDVFLGFLFIYPRILDFVDYIQSLDRPAENGVFIVKPGLLGQLMPVK
jgi:hypothetical protein